MDEMVNDTMTSISMVHKQSIVREQNKRHEKKKEELRKKREEEEERRKRKDRRNALRERKRLNDLKDNITNNILANAVQEEFSAKMKVYDVRDPAGTDDGIIIIGGFVGELIITFTCLLDYILASPAN